MRLDKQSMIILTCIGLVFFGIIVFNFYTQIPPSTWVSTDEQLPSNKVCMVNDAYMGVDQIEVAVEGQIYYGCCEMCVTTLNQKPESRYAIDPHSGEQVDKSTAFIYLNPDSNKGAVLYFKSPDNFEKYIQTRKK